MLKLIIQLIVICILLSSSIDAQSQNIGYCADEMFAIEKSRIEYNIRDPEVENRNFCIKLYFHLYRKTESDNYPTGKPEKVMDLLEEAFKKKGRIRFYYNPSEIIKETRGIDYDVEGCNYFNQSDRHADGIDIHITGDDVDRGGIAKGIGSDECFISNDNIYGETFGTKLPSHLIGHCLGLHHTWFGEPDNDCNYSDPFLEDCFGNSISYEGNIYNNDYIDDTGRDPLGLDPIENCDQTVDETACEDMSFQYNDIPKYNIMSYYFECREELSDDQIYHMLNVIPEIFDENDLTGCCDLDDSFNEVVTINDTWDEAEDKSKVLVKSGVTLTIEDATISFDIKGGITLEPGADLIVKNSKLTNLDFCDDLRWSGIKATGDGSLIELEGSTIEYAQVGISVKGDSDINTSVNSKLSNCGLGIHFSAKKYLLSINTNSTIMRTDFINNETAIWAEKTRGLELKLCEFIDNETGFGAADSHIDIKSGNYFEGGKNGVLLLSSSPMTSKVDIGRKEGDVNTFYSIERGIESIGMVGAYKVNIQNCEFNEISSGKSVSFSYSNSYTVKNNLFKEGQVISGITGSEYNSIRCNVFQDDEGIRYFGENSRSDFLENEFSGNQTDVSISQMFVSGTELIRDNIGMEDEAAGNCFSDAGADIDYLGTQSFTYHYFDDSQTSNCQQPSNPSNFIIDKSDFMGNRCDKVGIFQLIDPDDDGTKGFVLDSTGFVNHVSEAETKDSISNWIDTVVSMGGDDPRTYIREDSTPYSAELDLASEILDQWINYALFRSITTGNYELADTVLASLGSWHWASKRVGMEIEKGDLNAAQTLASNLPSNTDNEQVFKETQLLNLKRLRIETGETSEEVITSYEVNTLKEWALKEVPSSGYSSSLYYLLTGKILEIEGPAASGGSSRPTSINETTISSTKRIYPNPFTHKVNIESEKHNIREVRVFDLSGKLLLKENCNTPMTTIDMSNMATGVYIMEVVDKSGQTTGQKIIKQ